jgi:hypothetical protein
MFFTMILSFLCSFFSALGMEIDRHLPVSILHESNHGASTLINSDEKLLALMHSLKKDEFKLSMQLQYEISDQESFKFLYDIVSGNQLPQTASTHKWSRLNIENLFKISAMIQKIFRDIFDDKPLPEIVLTPDWNNSSIGKAIKKLKHPEKKGERAWNIPYKILAHKIHSKKDLSLIIATSWDSLFYRYSWLKYFDFFLGFNQRYLLFLLYYLKNAKQPIPEEIQEKAAQLIDSISDLLNLEENTDEKMIAQYLRNFKDNRFGLSEAIRKDKSNTTLPWQIQEKNFFSGHLHYWYIVPIFKLLSFCKNKCLKLKEYLFAKINRITVFNT